LGVDAFSRVHYFCLRMNKLLLCLLPISPLLGLIACADQSANQATAQRPNVLVLMADEHVWYAFGAAGHPIVKTPNLDRLASRGARFTSAYATWPACVAARMSMLTGKYPSEIGVRGNGDNCDEIGPGFATFFSEQGYPTMVSGKMHFRGVDQYHGFAYRPIGDYDHSGWYVSDAAGNRHPFDWQQADTDVHNMADRRPDSARPYTGSTEKSLTWNITERGLSWLDRDSPYLAMFSYLQPHWPWQPPQHYWEQYQGQGDLPRVSYDAVPAELRRGISRPSVDDWDALNDEEIRRTRAAYFAMITYVDDQIGRILDELERLGTLDNTIIVYTSDHGEMLGERGTWLKGNYFDPATRIPLLISYPPAIPAGTVIDTPVDLADVFPTLANLSGFAPPSDVSGESLVPLMQGNPEGCNDWAASGYGDVGMIRQDAFKLIIPSPDAGPWLFNLVEDPDELNNLADNPVYAEKVSTLNQLFHAAW
jgi:choline-sulfatase